jgi:isoquinoline 1-oxidoreductase beta subunit
MDRREFLKNSALGTGLIIGFHIPVKNAMAQFGPPPTSWPTNAFVRIAPDNTVTVISKHTEMGQGIYTGLATLIAEELDADWSQMKVESAPADVALYMHLMLGLQGTGGSMSIPNCWVQYRTVGAAARAMLVSTAAAVWDVPDEEVSVSKGIISHATTGRQAGFGEFAEAAASLPVPENVDLKTPDQFTLIGTSLPKVDSVEKSTGKATFTIDIQRPGMMTAVVAHAPRFGARLVSFDDTEARKIPGVVDVVEIPRGVAVLARNFHTAKRGRDALVTQWDSSNAEMRGSDDILRDYKALAEQPGTPLEVEGDSASAMASAAQTIDATYEFPFLSHAPMEPLNCTIEKMGSDYVLRSGTQMPSVDQQRVAEFFGVGLENVKVENLYAGGGFGRRGNIHPDLDIEVASIFKATGERYPVKLQYTREDDMAAGFYRPMNIHKMRAGLDGLGNITAWENRVVGQSLIKGSFLEGMIQNGVDALTFEGAGELPYHIPNVTVDIHMAQAGVPVLFWRSVGHTHTQFSKETLIDEALIAAGKDPVEGRLELMEDERSKAVIRQVAERSNWGKPVPAGVGRGFAFTEAFGGRVAQVVDVSRDRAGRIQVDKVYCAVDCGLPINPHIIEAQVESAIMYGLSAALYDEIHMENGVVETSNFHNYPVIRMNQAPEFDVHIMDSDVIPPSGIGEPATPGIAPAVANAWFQLTGVRVRRLPFERMS